MTKAFSDLDTAKQIGGLPNGHLDAGIYHCQQAAEKALKAFLIFHGQPFERIHDLQKIIEQAIRMEPGFGNHAEAAEALTPYAVLYRYPDEAGFLEPSREEFSEAVGFAQSIFDFVSQLLPKETHPLSKK